MQLRQWILVILAAAALIALAPPAHAQTITCSSDDGRRHWCPANTAGGVRMVRQRSDARCTQGSTWGFDRRGIWVDRGCRADFVVRGGSGGYRGPGPAAAGPGYAGNIISCSSSNGGRNVCPVNGARGVQLVRQRSDAQCIEGRTWGYDRRGIWVDRGCRADFRVR